MSTRTRSRSAGSTRTPRSPAARKTIDPRIRDRRVTVKRAAGRRRLRWFVAAVVLGCLAAVAWLVVHSPLLDVERVHITGAQQASAAEVRRAAGVHRGDPLLFVDTGAVSARVERVPWIDHARVDRRFSGDVDIHVTERRPVAWARRTPDLVALVDAQGRVLADTPSPPGDLPELSGLTRVPRAGHDVAPAGTARVLAQLPPELGLQTAQVVTQGAAVTLVLRQGPQVRLGTPDHVAGKSSSALAVLRATAGAPPGYIDVRVPSAPVTG